MKNIEAAYRHLRVKESDSKFCHRAYSIKKKYDMTLEEYSTLLESQDNSCAICGTHVSMASLGSGNHLHIDHNHETNEVRGLLCWDCNTGIGKLKDSVEILQSVILYLNSRGSYANTSS